MWGLAQSGLMTHTQIEQSSAWLLSIWMMRFLVLFLDAIGIHQVKNFHIALLKGSMWQGNGMQGIIHRSPVVLGDGHARVMLAIDAIW